jgi:hypothetical protein
MGWLSSAPAPPAPDYTALAEKTAASQAEAAAKQTQANRPNQVDIYGNTSTWTQDPASGTWTQKQALSPEQQQQLDAQEALRSRATSNATDALGQPLNTEGLRDYSDYDTSALQGVDAEKLRSSAGLFSLDPVGNSQAIQDATYGLLRPQREQATNSELQRLASQGLTEDSPAWQAAMLRQGQADTDAQLKSLLAGQQEYGKSFERASGQNKQNFEQMTEAEKFAQGLRGQQFNEQTQQIGMDAATREQQLNERMTLRNQPMSELQQILAMQQYSNPSFGNFASATGEQGTDYLGAAQSGYDAAIGNTNAKNASKAGTTSGIVGLAMAGATAY